MKIALKNFLGWLKRKILYQNHFSGQVETASDSLIEGSQLIGNIKIGRGTMLHQVQIDGNVEINRYTSLWGPNIHLNGDVSIGSFCSIARNTQFISYGHNEKRLTTYYIFKNFFKESDPTEIISKGKIRIGSDVWIGSNCVLMGGIKVGDGAIIGAGSIVTKDVKPFTIVAGNPAKPIGQRFDAPVIEQLQQLKWWDWSEEEIKRHKELFQSEITEDILKRIIKVQSNGNA